MPTQLYDEDKKNAILQESAIEHPVTEKLVKKQELQFMKMLFHHHKKIYRNTTYIYTFIFVRKTLVLFLSWTYIVKNVLDSKTHIFMNVPYIFMEIIPHKISMF